MVDYKFVKWPARRKAPTIPAYKWSAHRRLLVELDKLMSRAQIQKHMVEKYGFVATPRQYTRQFEKWGIRKQNYTRESRPAPEGSLALAPRDCSTSSDEARTTDAALPPPISHTDAFQVTGLAETLLGTSDTSELEPFKIATPTTAGEPESNPTPGVPDSWTPGDPPTQGHEDMDSESEFWIAPRGAPKTNRKEVPLKERLDELFSELTLSDRKSHPEPSKSKLHTKPKSKKSSTTRETQPLPQNDYSVESRSNRDYHRTLKSRTSSERVEALSLSKDNPIPQIASTRHNCEKMHSVETDARIPSKSSYTSQVIGNVDGPGVLGPEGQPTTTQGWSPPQSIYTSQIVDNKDSYEGPYSTGSLSAVTDRHSSSLGADYHPELSSSSLVTGPCSNSLSTPKFGKPGTRPGINGIFGMGCPAYLD